MSKVDLQSLANLQNDGTATSKINSNNVSIEDAFENTLSRDGTSPNQMGASLDMNSNRIINLPAAVSNSEPVRLADVSNITGFSNVVALQAAVDSASASSTSASSSATSASSSATTATNAVASLTRWRQVATRCYQPYIFESANKQLMTRTRHRAQDTITALKINIPNYYVDGVSNGVTFAELGTGASSIVKASIEYPAGTFTQVLFSGSSSGTVLSGQSLLSDSVTVSIPEGVFFYVRIYLTNTAGIVVSDSGADTARGEAMEFGASGITDKTLSGTVTQTSGDHILFPAAIIAQTAKKAVMLIGDSIMYGYSDATTPSYASKGYIARSLAPAYPLINVAIPGDRVELFLASHTNRLALQSYCDVVVSGYGRNSLAVGRGAATVVTDLISVWNLFTIPVIQTTLPPDTTSTDSWVTTTNQTVQSYEAERTTLNDNIRLENVQTRNFIDIYPWVESSINSGKWSVSPIVPTTVDGVHIGYGGTFAIRNSGVVEAKVQAVLNG